MQREEESSTEDAIPAMDSAKEEECKHTLRGCCTALLVKESLSEDENMVAARGGWQRSYDSRDARLMQCVR